MIKQMTFTIIDDQTVDFGYKSTQKFNPMDDLYAAAFCALTMLIKENNLTELEVESLIYKLSEDVNEVKIKDFRKTK